MFYIVIANEYLTIIEKTIVLRDVQSKNEDKSV